MIHSHTMRYYLDHYSPAFSHLNLPNQVSVFNAHPCFCPSSPTKGLLATSSLTATLPAPDSNLLQRLTGPTHTEPSSSRHFCCFTTLSCFSITVVRFDWQLKSTSSFLITAPFFYTEERSNIEAILGLSMKLLMVYSSTITVICINPHKNTPH